MEAAIHSEAQDTRSPYGGPNPHQLLPTKKQMLFARHIAQIGALVLPWEAQQSRRSRSLWIDAHAQVLSKPRSDLGLPSSKQVAFAERIARIKRRQVPDHCFKDSKVMSLWIDSNK